jgi:hypothetical protein
MGALEADDKWVGLMHACMSPCRQCWTTSEEESRLSPLPASLLLLYTHTANAVEGLPLLLAHQCRDFILSVAEAEEEERLRGEQEAELAGCRAAAAAAAAAGAGGRPGTGSFLPSHAAFVASLSREEQEIIEALSRKYQDKLGPAAGLQAQPQPRRPPAASLRPEARAALAAATCHLRALQQASREAAGPQAGTAAAGGRDGWWRDSSRPLAAASFPRASSRAPAEHKQLRVQNRLKKPTAAAAARAVPVAAGVAARVGSNATEGLTLASPHFSSTMLGA